MRSSVRAMADGLYDLTERKYRVWEYRRMARAFRKASDTPCWKLRMAVKKLLGR